MDIGTPASCVLRRLFRSIPSPPPSYSERDIANFQDPAIINRFHIQRKDYFSTYLLFVRHLYSYFLSLPVSLSSRLWSLQYRSFEWAYSIVISRSVTRHHLIIPFLDYRNFITTDSVRLLFCAHA